MHINSKDFLNSTKIHIPALLLSTLFLAALLVHYTLQSWQFERQRIQQEAQQTIENYVQQSTLLAQASYRTNSMVTSSNNSLIAQALASPNHQLQLNKNIESSIFNYTGYFVFNNHGDLLINDGNALSPNEAKDVWKNIHNNKIREGLFTLRYPENGGFYFYNRFSTAEQNSLYFVSRRSYSSLSNIIYASDFNNFELLLIDNRVQGISMRKGVYAESNNQTPLTADELDNLIYREPIPLTHWDVAAISVKQPQATWLLIKQPIYILVIYVILNIFFWTLLHLQRKRTLFFREKHSEQEHFSKQVLNSISDALIATDKNGHIQYTNSQAQELLTKLGHSPLTSRNLKELIPSAQALWNKTLTQTELKKSTAKPHILKVTVGDKAMTYQQSCSLLFRGNNITSHIWLLHDITSETQHKETAFLNEERYRALFNEAGVGHCIFDISAIDTDGITLIDTNQTAFEMAEADSIEQFLKETKRLTTDNEGVFTNELKTAIEGGLKKAEFELPITTFKNNLKHFWVSANLNSSLESHTHILASFTDITEQVNIHQTIKERELFWESIMVSIPNIVYIMDHNPNRFYNPIYSNRSLRELLGYPALTDKQDGWFEFILAEDHKKIRQVVANSTMTQPKQVIEASARFIHADGSIRIIKFRNTPFKFENGKITQYVGIARDITEEYEQQEKILESERRYRLLTENISDIIWTTDVDLNFNFVSPSVFKVLGYKPSELVESNLGNLFKKRDILDVTKRLERSIEAVKNENSDDQSSHKIIIQKDLQVLKKDGTLIILEIQASPLWNDAKELIGIIGISRDVTLARQLDDELKLSAEVFANSNEAIIITDRHLNIVNSNPAFYRLIGYSSEQLLGKKPKFLVSPDQYNSDFVGSIKAALESEGYWQGEIEYTHKDGSTRTAWSGISAMVNNDNEVQRLIGILSDITDKKNIEANIHRLAYFDSLTGLANRSQLNTHLKEMLTTVEETKEAFALLFLDLDRFKPINDTMGHPAGDLVLKDVAQRLSSSVKSKDLVCRMGGDEFTIALTPQPDAQTAADVALYVANRILEQLSQPYYVDKQEVFLSGSIGIAIYPQDGLSATELLKNADMAMYHAKDLGRNNVQFYKLSMNEKAKIQLEIENDLRHVLDRQELELYYQPQHAANTGVAVAAEALLRWNHPTKGLMTPNQFIPIMEDSGLIVSIGQWVLEQACQQFAEWHAQGLGLKRIAVNVSARQFHQKDFVGMVYNAIERTGIKANQLELELTESILIQDLEQTLNTLNSLRAMGVRIAIDDFGTGYSSLNYLKQFPVDSLKIDRTFIQNLPHNSDDAQITRTIIAMAHNLGMGVIAEGVETAEQLAFLQSTQCEEIQGYYFSRPLSADGLIAHLQSQNSSE